MKGKFKINKRYVFDAIAVLNIFTLKTLVPVTESQIGLYASMFVLILCIASALFIHSKALKDDECVNPPLYYGFIIISVILNIIVFARMR